MPGVTFTVGDGTRGVSLRSLHVLTYAPANPFEFGKYSISFVTEAV